MIKAVVFDLDDTLYPEYDYVKSGYNAVAQELRSMYGTDNAYDELLSLYAADRGFVFDRYLENHGLPADGQAVKALIDIYRSHTPSISLSDEARQTLTKLREGGYKTGIITDGRPLGQRAKISALGLNELVDRIIITDELGGEEYRKPNPAAFEKMVNFLGVALDEMLYVGDNPQKDFKIGKYGVKTARVYTGGIYSTADYADGIKEDIALGSIGELAELDIDGDMYKGQSAVRKLLLEIMDFIHDVCQKENIVYSLSGGTLIGAVRHKGFVPWDDDIDVTMKREQYEKFVLAAKSYDVGFEVDERSSRVPQVRHTVEPVVDGKRYHGVKIDIFILDNFPDDEKTRNKTVFKLRMLQGMMRKDKIYWPNYSLKGKLLLLGTKVLGAFRSMDSLLAAYKKRSTAYNDRPTEAKFIANDLYAVITIAYKNEWVENTVDATFEDRTYKIFDKYDSFLKPRYGNYMKLPPKDKRVPGHGVKATEIN